MKSSTIPYTAVEHIEEIQSLVSSDDQGSIQRTTLENIARRLEILGNMLEHLPAEKIYHPHVAAELKCIANEAVFAMEYTAANERFTKAQTERTPSRVTAQGDAE